MKPYYEEGGIVIYHGDNAAVLPHIDPADVDLLLTDPPYGMSHETDYGRPTKHRRGFGGRSYPSVHGDDVPFDPSVLLGFPRAVLWGANYYADRLPARGSWLVWDKDIRSGHPHRSQVELAWCSAFNGGSKLVRIPWDIGDRHREPFLHPTQKPAALMRWIVERWTKPGDLVLDPYMGSGPVAQACYDLGRRYIGIELVEDYCAAAVRRLGQGVLDFEGAS